MSRGRIVGVKRPAHQCRTDNHSIRVISERGRLVGSADTDPHHQRGVSHGTNPGCQLRCTGGPFGFAHR